MDPYGARSIKKDPAALRRVVINRLYAVFEGVPVMVPAEAGIADGIAAATCPAGQSRLPRGFDHASRKIELFRRQPLNGI